MNKQTTLFLVFTALWYLLIFIPYDRLAQSFGIVPLWGGHSWPLSFILIDALAIGLTIALILMVIKGIMKKKFTWYWILFAILLIFPLSMVRASLFDLVISPIAP